MARIRSIKPDLWNDPAVVGCSPLARLLFIGTWNHADDYGVLKDDPGRLKLQILPADDCDPAELIDELVDADLLQRKVARDGTPVLVIRTFCVHQKIDKRATGRWGQPDEFTDPPSPPTPTRVPNTPQSAASSPPIPTDPPDSQPDPTIRTEGNGTDRRGEETRSAEPVGDVIVIPPNGSSPSATAHARPPGAALALVSDQHPAPARGRSPSGYPSDFEAWWELYPRKVAKATAADAWKRARGAASWGELVGGLQRSIAVWQREQRPLDKIPHAATWLRARRWEDETEADAPLAVARPKGFDGIAAALQARGSAS